jgi:hypothetical protein
MPIEACREAFLSGIKKLVFILNNKTSYTPVDRNQLL